MDKNFFWHLVRNCPSPLNYKYCTVEKWQWFPVDRQGVKDGSAVFKGFGVEEVDEEILKSYELNPWPTKIILSRPRLQWKKSYSPRSDGPECQWSSVKNIWQWLVLYNLWRIPRSIRGRDADWSMVSHLKPVWSPDSQKDENFKTDHLFDNLYEKFEWLWQY